jgi:hypothetical protein
VASAYTWTVILGTAYSERDLREFLRRIELPDWEDIDLTDRTLSDDGGPAARHKPAD